MQVLGKTKVLILILFLTIFTISLEVKAERLDDAIKYYSEKNYDKALELIQDEIDLNPKNIEAYNWLGKTYEAIFEIENAMKAYNKYQELKSSIKPSIEPSNRIIKASPSRKPNTTKTPLAKPTPRPVLKTTGEGWKNITPLSIVRKKVLKIIPKDSVDLAEVDDNAGNGNEFILIKCKIKYNKNIIIKNNTIQISLVDDDDINYNLYLMSTYSFQYQGNKQSKKVESLQVSEYYQISKKDSRETITLVFKTKANLNFKELRVLDYNKKIDLTKVKILK